MFKVPIICILTILILCIKVNGKPIFYPVYSVLSYITVPAQNAVSGIVSSAFDSTQDYSKKIFDNSVPKVKDTVKSKASAIKKSGKPSEHILPEEKDKLDSLIKSHH